MGTTWLRQQQQRSNSVATAAAAAAAQAVKQQQGGTMPAASLATELVWGIRVPCHNWRPDKMVG
jgi:hypothetical protein